MDIGKEFYRDISDGLWAQAVGEQMLKIAKAQDWKQDVDSRAVRLLAEIQALLDDDRLDDPTCFRRMEDVLEKWNQAGLRTTRHQEIE